MHALCAHVKARNLEKEDAGAGLSLASEGMGDVAIDAVIVFDTLLNKFNV